MSCEEVVRAYLVAMAAGDLDRVLDCFTPDGRVSSPVYGGVPVADFYRQLFADTRSASVDLKRIYESKSGAHLAAHFSYRWERNDGTRTHCDLVDLFDFAPGTQKIAHLTIIFDTARIGKAD